MDALPVVFVGAGLLGGWLFAQVIHVLFGQPDEPDAPDDRPPLPPVPPWQPAPQKSEADRWAEHAAHLLTVMERLAGVAPELLDPVVDPPIDRTQQDDPYADISWDPTDNVPWLADPEFQHVAPHGSPDRPQPGDAPDIITHPLGIPGLEYDPPARGIYGLPDPGML